MQANQIIINIYDALVNWHTVNEKMIKSGPVGDATQNFLFARKDFYHCTTQDHNGPQANLD